MASDKAETKKNNLKFTRKDMENSIKRLGNNLTKKNKKKAKRLKFLKTISF